MTRNLSAHSLKASIVILVLVLHGATVWAMMSIETPTRAEIIPVTKPIQIELITLEAATKSVNTDSKLVTPIPENVKVAEPQSTPKSVAPKPAVLPAKDKPVLAVKESNKSLQIADSKIEETQDNISSTDTPNTESSQERTSSALQSATITESRTSSSDATQTEDSEFDLAAMIRAINAQHKREQAEQRRSLARQTDRKLKQQEEWRLQAENETITKMLALAAEQAAQQQEDMDKVDKSVTKSDEITPFIADYGSWQDEREPITSLSSVVWRSIDRDLGDVFIVLLELHVTKEGDITEVQILETSGSPIIDAISTTQVRGGQLNPIQQQGIKVDAIVPMSLIYERPS
ncbi:hypothetical protein [Psychrobacter sp. DM4]|uniref:hypothetical protein n=1 Tax=Psychrobacter sp. DM4 TaxID=3440637 RepID=UPI003F4FB6AA